jgi:hypothetical protein
MFGGGDTYALGDAVSQHIDDLVLQIHSDKLPFNIKFSMV